jgi:hypothetical protein
MRVNEPNRAGTGYSAACKTRIKRLQDSPQNEHVPTKRNRSRKNAHRKLLEAIIDLEWALKSAVTISVFKRLVGSYRFFL